MNKWLDKEKNEQIELYKYLWVAICYVECSKYM